MPTASAPEREARERLGSWLSRLRWRALAAEFLRLVLPAVTAGFALALVGARVQGIPVTPALLGGACGAALLLALVSTAWRRPSLAALAKEIDRKARLEQRVETSLELFEANDPASSLVLEDTLARTSPIPDAEVFPLSLEPDARWMGAAIVVVAAALLVVSSSGTPRRGTRPVAAGDAEAPDASVVASPPEFLEPGASTSFGEDGPRATDASDPNPPAEGDLLASEDVESRREPPVSPRESTASARNAEAVRSASPAEPAFERVEPFESLEPRGGGERSGRAEGETGASRDGREGEMAGPGASSEASGNATGSDAEASGEGRGSAAELRAREEPAVESGATREESPLPRDEIPPALADYVRAYFDRVRSPR